MFLTLSGPPWNRGMMWSASRLYSGYGSPHRWQMYMSRANTSRRLRLLSFRTWWEFSGRGGRPDWRGILTLLIGPGIVIRSHFSEAVFHPRGTFDEWNSSALCWAEFPMFHFPEDFHLDQVFNLAGDSLQRNTCHVSDLVTHQGIFSVCYTINYTGLSRMCSVTCYFT